MRLALDTLVISRRTDVERRDRFVVEAARVGLTHWAFFDAIDGPGMWLETGRPSKAGRDKRPVPEPL